MFRSRALSIRPFRLLLIGQLVSFFGDTMYYVLFLFMVKKMTGSNTMVGLIGAAESLPFLIFSAYAGVVADKFDRRKIMLIADLAPFAILAMFAVVIATMGTPPIWLLFVVAPCLSIATAFMLPARSAAMPRLVPKEHLLEANAIFAMFRNIVPMASLALSATVLSALWGVSQKWFFLTAVTVNGLTFLISTLYTRQLPTIVPEGAAVKHPLAEFVEGIRYLKSRSELMMLLYLSVLTSLIFAPFMVTYVAANDEWFGGKPGTLAFCELSYFAGMVLGSALVSRLKLVRVGMSFIWGIAAIGVTIAAMAFSKNIYMFAFWNLAAGIIMPVFQIPINTYSQLTVPDNFRGRVNSCFSMLGMGVMPVGQILGGAIIQAIGLAVTFLIMGLSSVATGLLGYTSKPFRTTVLPETESIGTDPESEKLASTPLEPSTAEAS
ncbi:MAG: MFS transporter [Fimbriimonadaceae bacterium]|nr:MFS transporter [Fimbriimonadaceae bacterium]